MTNYTIWNGTIPSGTTDTVTGPRTDGILFTVSSSCTLNGIGYYVASEETDLTGSSYTAYLWTTTSGATGVQQLSQAGTGTFTAGQWNYIAVSPFTLLTGTYYVAGISSPNYLTFLHSYWGSGDPGFGGITSGPINVPDATVAPGNNQQGEAAANTFPANASTESFYGVDIQVSTSGDATVSGSVSAASLSSLTGTVISSPDIAGSVSALSVTALTGTATSNAVKLSGPVSGMALSAYAGSVLVPRTTMLLYTAVPL